MNSAFRCTYPLPTMLYLTMYTCGLWKNMLTLGLGIMMQWSDWLSYTLYWVCLPAIRKYLPALTEINNCELNGASLTKNILTAYQNLRYKLFLVHCILLFSRGSAENELQQVQTFFFEKRRRQEWLKIFCARQTYLAIRWDLKSDSQIFCESRLEIEIFFPISAEI